MEIDAMCHCELCEARTQETYEMRAICTNCGSGPFTLRFRKGDKATGGVLGRDCPNCGNAALMLSMVSATL